MTYSLEISEDALYDVLEIIDWYREISSKLSIKFEAELNSRLNYLAESPLNFQIRYLKKLRIVPLKTFPYGIHFFIKEDRIFVVAVFHYNKNPKRWKLRNKKMP
ncbi:MAG: type II toxin-antitoxin system RelE/ParE family toxin [Pedobacter sp.]|nr:MAG: type II toxin-antitoxin system RelE/ParE family toxin [Pedobacter sp.]